MAVYFSILLVIITGVTGVVYFVNKFYLQVDGYAGYEKTS